MWLKVDTPRVTKEEFRVLELLLANGATYPVELVQAPGLEHSSIHAILKVMTGKGYVASREAKEPQQNERQPGLLRLPYRATEYGQRMFHAAELASKQLDKQKERRLSDAQRQVWIAEAEKLEIEAKILRTRSQRTEIRSDIEADIFKLRAQHIQIEIRLRTALAQLAELQWERTLRSTHRMGV